MTTAIHEVIGHEHPDVDCLAAQYLIITYLKPEAFVGYEPMKGFNYDRVRDAYAVVDMGDMFIPNKLRFDHHGHEGAPSATRAVWEHLMLTLPLADPSRETLQAIEPLITVIDRYDVSGMSVEERELHNMIGLHAQLSGFRITFEADFGERPIDHQCYSFFVSAFEQLINVAVKQADGSDWVDKVVFSSERGDIVALHGGTKAHSIEAQKHSDIVFFHNLEADGLHSVGAVTTKLPRINVRDVLREVMGWLAKCTNQTDRLVLEELASWHLDTRGFFGGRTRKGGVEHMYEPRVSIETIADAVSFYWGKVEGEGLDDDE